MKKVLSWLLLMLLVFTASCGTIASAENLVVYFLDVGQADAVILQCGDEAMMIDGGESSDSNLIYSYLTKTLDSYHDSLCSFLYKRKAHGHLTRVP